MSVARSYKDTIKNIINLLNTKWFLPELQRDYVWLKNRRKRKIEDLFESIYKGYPIGCFLLWKYGGENNIKIENFICEYDKKNPKKSFVARNNTISLVLDGQQRLSSLNIGLNGAIMAYKTSAKLPTRQTLYINLNYKENTSILFNFFDEAPKEKGVKWYSVPDLYKKMPQNLTNQQIVVAKQFRKSFNAPILCYEMTENTPIETALDVFTKINSGGMELSAGDLLMSFLTCKFSASFDVKRKFNRIIEAANTYVDKFTQDQLLNTLYMMIGEFSNRKKLNLSDDIAKRIEKDWCEIEASFNKTFKWLDDQGFSNSKESSSYFTINSGYIITLISLSYYRQITFDDEEMEKLVFRILISQVFSGAPNLGKFKDAFDNVDKFATVVKNLEKSFDISFTKSEMVDEIKTASYGKSNCNTLLRILYRDKRFDCGLDVDHIYNKAKFKDKNSGFTLPPNTDENGIWNLQVLPSRVNRKNKRDKTPEEFYAQKKNFEFKSASWLKMRKPSYKLDARNVAKFKREREKAIIWQICDYFELNRKKR